jgi:hypothetical protein
MAGEIGRAAAAAAQRAVAGADPAEIRGSNAPSLSIVIEWENAKLSEAQRARRMLEQLASQLDEACRDTGREVDILILYDPAAIDPKFIEAMLDNVRPRAAWRARVSLMPSAARGYYGQKNFGAAHTGGDIVLFVDSDVIPRPGWLGHLLGAFERPEIEVVGGSTCVETGSLYEKAVALFWLFPLRETEARIEEVPYFFANNIAFRRRILEENRFPELETFRGQCGSLANTLRGKGIRIFRHTGAVVMHPPPNGFRHFMNRAMCEGHDECVRDRRRGGKLIRPCFKDFWRRMRAATDRIVHHHGEVGLGFFGSLGAWGIAFAYYVFKLIGRLLTAIDPRIVRKHFPIS